MLLAEVRPFFAGVVLRLGDAGWIFTRGLLALTQKSERGSVQRIGEGITLAAGAAISAIDGNPCDPAHRHWALRHHAVCLRDFKTCRRMRSGLSSIQLGCKGQIGALV
jgi:hypothetical protein